MQVARNCVCQSPHQTHVDVSCQRAQRHYIVTPLAKSAEYCDQPVCLCVCLSVREHIAGTAGSIATKFCVRISCGRGSVLLWRRCARLCNFGLWMTSRLAVMGRMALRGLPERYTSRQIRARPGRSLKYVYECLVLTMVSQIINLSCVTLRSSTTKLRVHCAVDINVKRQLLQLHDLQAMSSSNLLQQSAASRHTRQNKPVRHAFNSLPAWHWPIDNSVRYCTTDLLCLCAVYHKLWTYRVG